MKAINKIGILTSGGDAPGMNPTIRAAVRTANAKNIEIVGIYRGYEGLIDGDFKYFKEYNVANIIQRGGTVLKSARSERFKTKEGLKEAHRHLVEENIDALIVIGGDGTFRGANIFKKKFNYPIIGLPGTIDNDLYGTDYTIGFDTALNTVVSAVDKIRDTAMSHNRLFIVEVMGRDAGFIALHSGLAVGAEDILIPETENDLDMLVEKIKTQRRLSKTSGIIIVAEGDESGGALNIAKELEKRLPDFETRVTILGHIQRGGAPSCFDRILAARLGYASVEALLEGKQGGMLGIIDNKIKYTPFDKATKLHHNVNKKLLDIARIISS